MTDEYTGEHEAPAQGVTNTTYDRLKLAAVILLPAIQVFWIALATIWGWAFREEVSATIGAFNVLAGAVLLYLGKIYSPGTDGDLHVLDKGDHAAAQLDLPVGRAELLGKDTVTLKVVKHE